MATRKCIEIYLKSTNNTKWLNKPENQGLSDAALKRKLVTSEHAGIFEELNSIKSSLGTAKKDLPKYIKPNEKTNEEPLLEGVQAIGNEKEAGQESTELRPEEEKEVAAEEITLFRGVEPKKGVDGKPKTVHKIAKGKFGSAEIEGTDGNKGSKPIKRFTIPAGTTIETVKLPGNTPAATSRVELETAAIDKSTAQVVKLETIDASGTETQYIIKDDSILESGVDMTTDEETAARKPNKRRRLVSDEAYAKAQKEIKDAMGNLGSGTGFKGAGALATIAAKHIEDGAISLKEVSAKMIADYGEKIKPYIKAAYDAATKGRSKVQELAGLANNIDGLKSKITDNAEALKIVSTEVKKLIKDSKLSSFSKRAVSKIVTKMKDTKSTNFDKVIDSITEIIDKDIERATRKQATSNRMKAYMNLGRLGILKELKEPLMKMLKIDPTLLSSSIIEEYNSLVDEVAKKGKKFAGKTDRAALLERINNINEEFTADAIKANELYNRISGDIQKGKTISENLNELEKSKKISKSEREILERFSSLLDLNTKESKDTNARDSIDEDFQAVNEEEQSEFSDLTEDEIDLIRKDFMRFDSNSTDVLFPQLICQIFEENNLVGQNFIY